MVIGLLVLALGVLWLLRNVGVINYSAWHFIFSWQMLLIAIGIINLSGDGHKGVGWILIAVGGFFMLNEIFYWPVTFRHVWNKNA